MYVTVMERETDMVTDCHREKRTWHVTHIHLFKITHMCLTFLYALVDKDLNCVQAFF